MVPNQVEKIAAVIVLTFYVRFDFVLKEVPTIVILISFNVSLNFIFELFFDKYPKYAQL